MIDVIIEATNVTPLVKIDSSESYITIKGKSSPPNSLQFYYPIIDKVRTLFANASQPIHVNIAFRYFNTSSSKCLFDFFKMLRTLARAGKDITIYWHYEEEDEDMLETGEDYADLLGLNFKFIEVEEIDDVMRSYQVA